MNKKEKEILKVVSYDIEAMHDYRDDKDYEYFYKLAKGNLTDVLRGYSNE